MITKKRFSDSRRNSMWRNTEARRGAITTPTNCDRLDNRWAALAITFCGCSGMSWTVGNCSCCTVSMVSTNRR